ncbi:MAG: ABC transporter substrate-binding protein [Candidatus Methanofastidiosum sp.]|nr:ABC transporter substrate-binding protein [Methanofastidiosum sp.]
MEQNFFKKYRIFFLAGLVVLVFAFGANLLQFTGRNITLTVWGTHLSEQEFNTYVGGKNIRLKNTQVTFEYQEIKPEEYEQKLFNAFIRNESPDIFMVNNFQLGQFGKLIYPFNLDNKSYNIGTIQRDFPTIIEKEAVISNYLYISPLSIDTLALYYNRNIFDSLAIPAGPRT